MDLSWTTSLDQLWRSPTFPMWLTLAAAAFFAIVFLVIVLRADRSVANGALTVVTLLAIAVAAAATVRGLGGEESGAAAARASFGGAASMPALSCVDDLAGDGVETACEKVLFGSPDHVAAAVSYAAARLDRLTALGDVTAASRVMTPELQALRRAVERDRYGLVAHVLVARDGCTAAMCPAFRSLTDQRQVVSNIEGRVYDGLVTRYTPTWSGALAAATDSGSAPSPASSAAAAALQPPGLLSAIKRAKVEDEVGPLIFVPLKVELINAAVALAYKSCGVRFLFDESTVMNKRIEAALHLVF